MGGPLVRDKLWFFAGFAPQLLSTGIDRIIQARQDDGTGAALLGSNGIPLTHEVARTRYTHTATSYQFAGKLTWLASEDHRLSLSVYGNPTVSRGANDLPGFGEVLGTGEIPAARIRGNESTFLFDTVTGSTDAALTYTGKLFGKSMLL